MHTDEMGQSSCLRFGRFALDLERRRLLGAGRPIELRPKSFKLLQYLVEHPERLIPKEEMVRAVWQHAAVTDDSLARCVSEVRTALGDLQRRMLKTVPRRGYVLTVPVSRDVPGTAAEQPSLAVLPFMTLGADRVHR